MQALDAWQAEGSFSVDSNDPSQLKCDVCNVKATNQEMMQRHILTKQHQKRSRTNEQPTDFGYNCEVCSVRCSSSEALDQHK